jgi:hypothetical protein
MKYRWSRAYLRGSNILASASYATCLNTTLRIDSLVPSCLYIFLDIKDGWYLLVEDLMSLKLDTADKRAHHLNVSIPAEPACDGLASSALDA